MFKKMFYVALIIIGILGIADTLFVMRIAVGVTAGTLAPGAIGIAFIIYAILKLKLNGGKIIKNKVFRRIIISGFCLFIALFIVVESFILVNAYSKQYEKTETNFVVVLGCGVFPDGRLTLSLMKRLNVAYDYLLEHPDTLCIVSGGQGPNEPTTEAWAMEQYLLEKGFPAERIIKEENSTSTSENLKYSKEIMMQYNKDMTVAIATSDFHIFRTKMLAKYQGLDAIGLPSSTAWYIWINSYLREFLAVIKSIVFDM